MMSLRAVAGTLLLAASGAPLAAQSPSPVGVWDIVELVDWTAEGERTEPMGSDPNGVFVYTPRGTLILHITTDPLPAPLELPPSVDEVARQARTTIAYYGTYTVDRDAGVITHHIEGDLFPNRAGESRERPYRIEGDELVLDFTAEDGRRFMRRLVRIESLGPDTRRPRASAGPPRVIVVPEGEMPERPSLAEILEGPVFVPYTRAPQVLNRDEVSAARDRERPPEFRDTGAGGTVRVWLLLDEEGRVLGHRIDESSGDAELDAAALRVARVFRFSPAFHGDDPTYVWISVPIVFEG